MAITKVQVVAPRQWEHGGKVSPLLRAIFTRQQELACQIPEAGLWWPVDPDISFTSALWYTQVNYWPDSVRPVLKETGGVGQKLIPSGPPVSIVRLVAVPRKAGSGRWSQAGPNVTSAHLLLRPGRGKLVSDPKRHGEHSHPVLEQGLLPLGPIW